MKAHPFADYLPMLDGAEWQSFLEDVKARGVLYPIVTHDGLILDGRNRWRAAQELGIECATNEFKGEDVLAFVMSSNLHRRHLSTQQRAEIAASMANVEHGGDRANKRPNGPLPFVTIAEAAAVMKVSERSVKRAKQKKKAAPRPRGMQRMAIEAGLASPALSISGPDRKRLRKELEARGVAPEVLSKKQFAPEESEQVQAAIDDYAKAVDAKRPIKERYEEHRREVASLPEPAKAKLDRLVAAEIALVREAWQCEVRTAAEAMVPELKASKARFDEEHRNYVVMRKGIAGVLSEDDYRFLLNALHPDREPNRDKLNKSFLIVQGLEEYIRVSTRSRP